MRPASKLRASSFEGLMRLRVFPIKVGKMRSSGLISLDIFSFADVYGVGDDNTIVAVLNFRRPE